MILAEQQKNAIERIREWFDDPDNTSSEFTLGGYAGTGKTTIIKEIMKIIHHSIVAAFTGKAVSVLRKKGCSDALTIHSMIYIPRQTKTGVEFSLREELEGVDLIIIDEASMISRSLYDDLKSFSLPILWVGDPGQLEPIGDDISLMRSPQIVLNEIHRQGEGSDILKLATHVRGHESPHKFVGSSPEIHLANRRGFKEDISSYDQILCGFNRTRVQVNGQVRRFKRLDSSLLNIGERLICLRNNTKVGVFNGMQMTLEKWNQINSHVAQVTTRDDLDRCYHFKVYLPQLGNLSTIDPYILKKYEMGSSFKDLILLDYSYCITTHKSQGSEWDSVVVIEELWDKWDSARWRYTAVTRAAKKLLYLY